MSLEPAVAGLILLTALMHASWNAVVKSSSDRLLTATLVTGTGSVLAAFLLPWSGVPDRAAWPYLGSSLVVHSIYLLSLVRSYRDGDLSQVYPIARGLAPPLVALLSLHFAGEVLTRIQVGGLVLVSCGLGSLALGPRGVSGAVRPLRQPVAFAVLTGIMIGGYTFLDGSGLRRSGSALSYIVWHTFLTGIPIVCITLWQRRGRVLPFLAREGRKGVLAGVVATLGYAIVLWAMERGALAMVSALRETSVIFAALIGSLLLGEPIGRRRMQAALGVVTGVALIILAG